MKRIERRLAFVGRRGGRQHELVAFCRRHGEEQSFRLDGALSLTAIRGAYAETDT